VSESSADRRALLATCVAAAVRAADVIKAGAARLAEITVEVKGPSDFVSQVDRDAEAALSAVILERHPAAKIMAEEGSPRAESRELLFVADPLDGTTNFLHGFPWYAVSIAALVNGKQEAAVVLNAANGELFTAVAGGGARRSGQPIHVSKTTDPGRALLGTGFPFKNREGIAPYMEILPRLMESTAGLRRAGSAALDLCDVACGRFDAFWEYRLAPWDVAAGILIIREAGGIATDLRGQSSEVKQGPIVAGNPTMQAWLLSQLTQPESREPRAESP
jgi:myo-inositol-1(or 4)-monophosphatase